MSDRLRKRSRPAGGCSAVAASDAAGALRKLTTEGAVACVNGSAQGQASHNSMQTRPQRGNHGGTEEDDGRVGEFYPLGPVSD